MDRDLFLKNLLLREVTPATGCTEIGSVALATGWAVRALSSQGDNLEEIRIEVKDGIMGKDVMDTLRNLQKIMEGGMASMDATIVEVMEAKKVKAGIGE